MNKLETVLKRYVVDDKTGCWNWAMSVNYSGYGQLYFNGKQMRASRFFYEKLVGSIPEDLLVLHRCDNRRCVNPKHLFLGTHQDNIDDRDIKGRARGGRTWANMGETNG